MNEDVIVRLLEPALIGIIVGVVLGAIAFMLPKGKKPDNAD